MHPVDKKKSLSTRTSKISQSAQIFIMNPDFPQNIQVIETNLINIRKIEKEPYF